MATEVRAQRLRRDQFDRTPQQFLEKENKLHVSVETLLPGRELDQQVYIAFRGRLVADKAAEKPEPPHPEGTQLGFMLLKKLEDSVFGRSSNHAL